MKWLILFVHIFTIWNGHVLNFLIHLKFSKSFNKLSAFQHSPLWDSWQNDDDARSGHGMVWHGTSIAMAKSSTVLLSCVCNRIGAEHPIFFHWNCHQLSLMTDVFDVNKIYGSNLFIVDSQVLYFVSLVCSLGIVLECWKDYVAGVGTPISRLLFCIHLPSIVHYLVNVMGNAAALAQVSIAWAAFGIKPRVPPAASCKSGVPLLDCSGITVYLSFVCSWYDTINRIPNYKNWNPICTPLSGPWRPWPVYCH